MDILGQLKAISISSRELEHALKDGMGLDGSSVEGFARIYESDLILLPDPDTFAQLPSAVEGEQSAVMFGDILTPEGEHYPGDTRYVLKRNLVKMRGMGFENFMVGPELEYFYFKGAKNPETLDSKV